MRRSLRVLTILVGIGLTLAAGCGQTEFSAALDASLQAVERIRNDNSLEPQEKRDALANELNLDPNDPNTDALINGLLQGEPLANQFGGTLSSAFDKVTHVDDARWTDLTPDEVQFYGDAADVTKYADAEAQAIVDFFNDNATINTSDGLEDFLDNPANELPAAIDETNLRAVFIDTSVNDVRDKLP